MLARFKIPKTILWTIDLFMVLLLFFTTFRVITFFAFHPPDIHFSDCVGSFFMGIQYDLRWIAIIIFPIILLGIQRRFTPFYSVRNRRVWTWYFAATFFIVFFFFIADLVSFSYNRTRLDAGAMNFVEDPGISISMIWQTYPLIWILIGLALAIFLFNWLLTKSHLQVITGTSGKAIPHRKGPFVIGLILLTILIFGRIYPAPLKWKDSFSLKDSFKTYLALNPLQNFFSTMRLREPVFNENEARRAFPLMADFLQLPQNKSFDFARRVQPRSGALESKPNVVLIMCESFSMYKSSMSGNPLNTTSYFDSLTKQGIFFERCFSPHFSTARGLFAIITGIPDVQLFKFSTRNPAAMNQHTIINDFTEYSKHYFLGGDPEFNNFDGLLKNINHLQEHTEKTINAPKINVWGISDKDLFLEANHIFKKETKPFFAIIQTSDNHRPYTIPEADNDFVKKEMPQDSLVKYGFGSLEEYNAFRYSDYCFKKFIEVAKKEIYFQNTIFVFVGDHGVAGNATAMYPSAWTNQRLSDEHVPLLFYAPVLLEPQLRKEIVSQIDVLPTIAGFINMNYTNTTLGRDLLDPNKKNNLAFITNTAGKIGIVTDELYYIKSLEFAEDELVPVQFHPSVYTAQQLDSINKKLSLFADAYYQTALYLLMNNKQN
jgi:phosphoglycerol transferase MdoB-like AlkP superfamily enzyme